MSSQDMELTQTLTPALSLYEREREKLPLLEKRPSVQRSIFLEMFFLSPSDGERAEVL